MDTFNPLRSAAKALASAFREYGVMTPTFFLSKPRQYTSDVRITADDLTANTWAGLGPKDFGVDDTYAQLLGGFLFGLHHINSDDPFKRFYEENALVFEDIKAHFQETAAQADLISRFTARAAFLMGNDHENLYVKSEKGAPGAFPDEGDPSVYVRAFTSEDAQKLFENFTF